MVCLRGIDRREWQPDRTDLGYIGNRDRYQHAKQHQEWRHYHRDCSGPRPITSPLHANHSSRIDYCGSELDQQHQYYERRELRDHQVLRKNDTLRLPDDYDAFLYTDNLKPGTLYYILVFSKNPATGKTGFASSTLTTR